MAYACSVLADSVNAKTGDRVCTMLVTYPLIVHAEFVRKRAFSYSVASNRAIPVKTLIDKVKTDPFVPKRFPKYSKGMVPDGYLEGVEAEDARLIWMDARDDAVTHAERLLKANVAKQITNRVLAPFQWVTQLTTGDWVAYRDFFIQRCHPDAQDEIHDIADMMQEAWNTHTPALVAPGGWHLPFIGTHIQEDNLSLHDAKRASVARSARTSYLTHDGEFSLERDFALHDRLLVQNPPHTSPFEHQLEAQPDSSQHANFRGWKTYRRMIEEGDA